MRRLWMASTPTYKEKKKENMLMTIGDQKQSMGLQYTWNSRVPNKIPKGPTLEVKEINITRTKKTKPKGDQT